MRGFGVHVVGYHKYRFWRPRLWSLIRRNHRKTLVCDGALAFTGGINISNEWVSQAEGGGGWLDAAVAVEGPAAVQIEATFLRTWNRRAPKRMRLDPDRLAVPKPAGGVALAVVSNSELRDRFVIRRAALHAIRQSQQRILLANPYFVPDQGVLRALQSAARRGVDVRLLVPLASDSRLLDFATRAVFPQLLAAAARIFRSPVVTHTKALMVDDAFFSIGSYNFDHRSLAYNLELVVNVVDPTTAVEVGTMLISDMAASEELTPPPSPGAAGSSASSNGSPTASAAGSEDLFLGYFFLGGFFAAGGLAAGLAGLTAAGSAGFAAALGAAAAPAAWRAFSLPEARTLPSGSAKRPISPPPANGRLRTRIRPPASSTSASLASRSSTGR